MMETLDVKTYRIEDVLRYKSLNTDMPEELLQFNEQHQIIADTRNDIVIRHRKQISEKQIEPVDAIKTAINSALNKLTTNNIKAVKDELLSIQKLSSPEYVNLLADALIQRASNEKNFVETYAKMCQLIAPLKCTDGTYFSVFISEKCFKIFNIYTTQHDSNSVTVDRNIVINFIKFIGWLYIYDLLRVSVVNVCINKVSENILKLDYGVEMITSILEIVSKKYFTVETDKACFVLMKLAKLCEIELLCKRDKILLQLTIEKIKKLNVCTSK